VKVLIRQIRDYIQRWNSDPKPFAWTATADEILAKVRLDQTNIKKLVDNNGKQKNRNHETIGISSPRVERARRALGGRFRQHGRLPALMPESTGGKPISFVVVINKHRFPT
jgi:hypothetical protein